MIEPPNEEVAWIRHATDGGLWWPALYVGSHEETSMLAKVVRDANVCGVSSRDPESPLSKFKSSEPAGKANLFVVPYTPELVLVQATQRRDYFTAVPPAEGPDKCYDEEAKTQMDKLIQAENPLDITALLTPSSTVESKRSTANRETPLDVASRVWWPSGTLRESPASSSTGTEHEVPVTPREPIAGFRVTAQASGTLSAGGNDSERELSGEENKPACEMSTCVASDACSPQSGAKRSWAETSHVQQREQCPQDREGTGFPGANVERAQGKSPRRECFTDATNVSASSQFPRLGGLPTSPGSHFCGTQRTRQGLPGAGMEMAQCDARRGKVEGVVGSTEGSCGQYLCQGSSGDLGGVDNSKAGRPRQAGVETLPAQRSMDVCGVELAADAIASDNRDASTPPGEAAPADAIAEEAAQFRKAGITGDEKFKLLSPKLKKLGWGWGGPVGPLSDNTWFLKAGAKRKTAQAGVGKFETGDDVVRYVRTILEVRGANTPDGEGGEVAMQADSDSADESSGSDSLDKGGRVEEEQGTPGPIEGEPLSLEGQALQTALEALHPSKAPGVMKQRATEFERVLQFIVRSAKDPSGGSLYLCGCPGTGKTQTMAHVQTEVRRVAAKGAFPTPAFHAFNGTAFTDPNAMHTALWRAITCGKAVPVNIEKELSKKLKLRGKPTSTSPMLVVVLDEIDQLMSKNRQVLRKLFEWADAPKSRVVLVGIANSIEFNVGFHNLSKPPAKVLFQAYTPEDLMSILTERVGEVVQKPAVQLCSKKIAATHGDARRAISLCREAVVLARRDLQDKLDNAVSQKERENVGQQGGVGLVTIRHMSMALSAGRVSRYADAIAALSIQAQIVLSVAAAAVREDQVDGSKARKRARLTQGDLHEKCMSVWGRLRTGGGLTQIDFSWTIDMLEAQGLLKLKGKQHAGGRARQLVLHVDFSDVETALGRHPFFKEAVSI